MSLLRRKDDDSLTAAAPTAELERLREDLEALKNADHRRQAAALRIRVDTAIAAARALEQRGVGGPCIYCGTHRCFGGWQGNPGRQACADCVDDRFGHTDAEHKSLVLNRITTGDWSSRRFSVGGMADDQVTKAGFKWWHESQAAAPLGTLTRWGYADLDAIRDRALARPTPPAPTPTFEAGSPCGRCGCAYLWRRRPGGRTAPIGMPVLHDDELPPAPLECAGCASFTGLADVAWRIIGVRGSFRNHVRFTPPPNAVFGGEVEAWQVMGLTWFSDRAVRSDERARQVTLTPWAYLDLESLRRKAFQFFDLPGYWRDRAMWQRLKAEAEGTTR